MSDSLDFRKRLLKGELLIGSMLTLPSPEIAELMSMVGFDWLFLDLEHGLLDVRSCQALIQAMAGRSASVLRLAENSEREIKQALDIGANGIIVPRVNTAEEASSVVKFAKYAPQGERGVGYSRAHGYGLSFSDYVQNANEKTSVIIQIEDIKGVNNIEAISRVEGIDAIFIGPYDLSASMGLMGQVAHPEVLSAMQKVELAANQQGIKLGYFGLSTEAVQPMIEKGYTLIVCGTDTSAVANQSQQILNRIKKNG